MPSGIVLVLGLDIPPKLILNGAAAFRHFTRKAQKLYLAQTGADENASVPALHHAVADTLLTIRKLTERKHLVYAKIPNKEIRIPSARRTVDLAISIVRHKRGDRR